MSWRRRIALLLVPVCSGAAEDPPFFSSKDLGTLGGRESRAYALNEAGFVVGESATRSGEMHAFLWNPSGSMTDLGTLGGPTSRANDIGEKGAVVGEADDTNGVRQPFLWTAGAGMRALKLPAGAIGGAAHGIRSEGPVVGSIDFPDGSIAALWSTADGLPELLTATGRYGVAFAVSSDGRVVGQADEGGLTSRVTRAFQRDPGGVVAALSGGGEGLSSAARAVNARGQVAGWQERSPGVTHAFLFDGEGWRNLDVLNDVYSSAEGLNDAGDVVGCSIAGRDDDAQGFIRTSGGFYRLDELVRDRGSGVITEAWDLTEDRRIAACMLVDGRERAVLLTPTRAPESTLPGIRLVEPKAESSRPSGQPVRLEAEVDTGVSVKRVTFLANQEVVGTVSEPPYRLLWTPSVNGSVDLVARVLTVPGLQRESPRIRIRVGGTPEPAARVEPSNPGSAPMVSAPPEEPRPRVRVPVPER